MGQDPDIAPWDAPDPSTLKASATPTPARREPPATPIGPRRRRSLLDQTTAVDGIPEREFDPDLQAAAPIDAPVPVAAHLARAGIDADIRVNTQTPPPVRRADESAETVEPATEKVVPLASDTLVPEPALESDVSTDGTDPVLEDWTVDDQGDEELIAAAATRSWLPLAVGVGAVGTVALLAALALGVGWRIEAGLTEAPVTTAAVPPSAPIAEAEPRVAADRTVDEAPADDEDGDTEALAVSTPEPVRPAPARAPASVAPTRTAPARAQPRPAPPVEEPAATEPSPERPPPPPAAEVRPRSGGDAPPQATVRPIREEDGRKVWAPWGEDAEAPPEAEEPAPQVDEDDEGDIWGATE